MMFYPRPAPNQKVSWLGGLTPKQFMARHWQKKPLLVRGAFPEFEPAVTIQTIRRLATLEDAQSRLIQYNRKKNSWSLDHGPFESRDIPAMAAADWTILVQQVNTLVPEADRFLDAFRFIPEARLDDLMISIAGPGGGVGPHVDSYDVFLIQAGGSRRWQIAQTKELELHTDAPIKLLKRFKAQESWVLEPGDLLYLPPSVAHLGEAIGKDCMTWSVGFRAPAKAELADLVWSDHLDTVSERQWSDPWLTATSRPGEIPKGLLTALTDEFMKGLPKRKAAQTAIARALSEPAREAFFSPPKKPDSLATFQKKAARKGLNLHPASRLLYGAGGVFVNGEPIDTQGWGQQAKCLKALADTRQLNAKQCVELAAMPAALGVLCDMYRAGWLVYH